MLTFCNDLANIPQDFFNFYDIEIYKYRKEIVVSYIDKVGGKGITDEYIQPSESKTNTKNETTATQKEENDVVNITDETKTTLEELESELKTIPEVDSSNTASIFSRIQSLKSNISIYTRQLTYLEQQIEGKQTQLTELINKLDEVQKEYDEIEEKIEEKQKDLDEVNAEIEKINKQIEKLKKTIENADGNASEDEIQAACSKLSSCYASLSELYSKRSNLEDAISSLNTDLESKANTIAQYQTQISALETTISTLSEKQSSITTQKSEAENELNESMKSVVSEEEWALVEQNNIDLTEKLSNGEPRYIFAQGKSDNQYHIYDMAANSSLARIYCPDGGYDIISSGNGNISSFSKTDNGSGSTVFYMDDCETFCEFNACYSTCSPLSFDINGNGVQTSNKIINYDIDGDGVVDKINDSADAVLVFDKDGNGISGEDGSECFGNNTDLDGDNIKDGYKDGFEALKALAKENNLINGKDDNVLDTNDIQYLEENFGFKIKANGYGSEAVSLKDLGITEINLGTTDETTLIDNFDGQGNQLMKQQGATFTINGETKEYADIWHKKILSDTDKTSEIFAGDSLTFSINGSLNYSNFITTNKTSSDSSDDKEGLKEIREAQREARAKLKEIKDEKK